MLCRHCQKSKANRPRGLCWTCYYTPGVREKYPSTSKFGRRGLGNFCGNAPLSAEPTSAAPGSEAKIRILMERARRKQALFHPADSCFAASSTREAMTDALTPEVEEELVESGELR